MRICLALSIVLLSFLACQSPDEAAKGSSSEKFIAPGNRAITESEAIQLAEQYLYEKGYTDVIPESLTLENANLGTDEFATSLEGVIKLRRNTLEPKALEARLYKKKTRWAVGFEYINKEDNIGRCVSMDTLGANIKVLEGQLRLDWLYNDQPQAVRYLEQEADEQAN